MGGVDSCAQPNNVPYFQPMSNSHPVIPFELYSSYGAHLLDNFSNHLEKFNFL